MIACAVTQSVYNATMRTLLLTVVSFVLFAPMAQAAQHKQLGLRMYGARPVQWEWAKEAQQNVPLADMHITVQDGNAMFSPPVLNPGQYINILFVPFSNLPVNEKNGWTPLAEHGLFVHELGHAYDFADMTPARRNAFKALAETTCSWWDEKCVSIRWVTSPDYKVVIPPGEMFAEEYAACALGLTQSVYQAAGYNSYGWVPPQDNPNADQQMCDLIRGSN
jgi:hypothetical protein